ncbi:uncharacterized protein LOC131010642 [Salvia miltiorrhiza]|uniref:uncharacterized protein LOC131010642 n=1 Tax=Salvia miltiorrhiza TaxID=226208 RepID=UPI0025AD9C79|nr:uncharacterized protein LOC131010642 [Salvia miltiorrhiza]
MEEQMASLNLSNEDDELILDDEITADSTVSVDLCLVGRFLTDQPINFNLMRSRLASIWRPGKGVFMKDIGQGRFIFQFFHELDLKRVYEGGPWAFGNFPLILHRLKKGEFPLSVPLDLLPFWVQIHDLPAGFLTEGVGKLLGNFIGSFMEYDNTNSSGVWRQYMRIRVGIRVNDPLKRFKKLKQKDGTPFTVRFKYERLNVFCFLCGKLGHSESYCELLFNEKTKDMKREWGVDLKAADRRSPNLAGDKWLRVEDGGNPSKEAAAARVDIESHIPDPKRKLHENRDINIPVTDAYNYGNQIIPNPHRLALQNITSETNGREAMQTDATSLVLYDDRKRRRGGPLVNHTTSSSANFPTEFSGDVNDEFSSQTAGSGLGAGRAQ